MQIDMFAPSLHAGPHTTFAALRAHAPAHQVTYIDGQPAWLITRYDDVVTVLRDRRFVSDPRRLADSPPPAMPVSRLWRLFGYAMLSTDPPDHPRLRRLVQMAFTPRMVERMRPRVQAIADALIDGMVGRGEVDLIEEYAMPLPMTVITELLGIPEECGRFLRWFDLFAEMTLDPDLIQRQEQMAGLFIDLVHQLLAERRLNPRDDLLTALAHADDGGDQLSEDELLSMVFLVIFAGHETTTNLIGGGTLALFEHPDQLARLRADLALVPAAVEELLRYASPAQCTTVRFASCEVELGGVTIPRGGRLLAMLGSANRDERRFADADRLDLSRAGCPHVAFGTGIHQCMGAPLARLEGEIAIMTLLRRLPDLRLLGSPDDIEWRSSFHVRGPAHLPVAF